MGEHIIWERVANVRIKGVIQIERFVRKYWRVLAGAMLAVIFIVVYLFIPFGESDVYDNPERVEEVLADYRQNMEAKPSAKIARKMLNFTIAYDQPGLVYTVLKENIYPWAGARGVGAEFIRGSKWYIKNNPQADHVLWLAKAIHNLGLAANFNEDLAEYYLTLSKHKAVRCGNIIFADWTLNVKARERYLSSLSEIWASSHLPIQPGTTFIDKDLFDFQSPLQLVDVPEFKDVSLYLHLWITCWRGNLDEEFVSSLLQLSPKSDPLDLYWRLWAVALLRDLGEKWHNPLGLDVAAKLPEVFPHLSSQEIEILYSRRDLKSPEHNLLLLKLLAARPEVGTMWGREVAAMLINAAGYEESELDKVIIHSDQYSVASAEVLNMYNRLARHYADSFYFQKVEAILGQVTKSPFILEKSAEFALNAYNLNFSPVAPAVLVNSDSGLTLFNLSTFKETIYPGCVGAWSIRGDCFALLKPSESKPIIRIMSPVGKEISRFTLAFPLPKEKVGTPLTEATWHSPWELDIVYGGGTHRDVDEIYGSLRFRFNINTQSLQEISTNEPSFHYRSIPGTDLYYQYPNPDLIDAAGEKRGNIVFSTIHNCQFQDMVFSIQGDALMVEIAGTARKVLDEVYELRWVASPVGSENIYVSVYAKRGETYLTINRKDGAARLIRSGLAGSDEVSYTLIQGGQQQEIIHDSQWHYPDRWHDGQARTFVLSADGGSMPILFTGADRIKMIKIGNHYILILGSDSDEVWMLKYRIANP